MIFEGAVIPAWIYPVLIWTIIWKAIGAWKAARKGHLIWFISFFVFNTAGILPMIYIFFFQNFSFSKKGKGKVPRRRGKKSGKVPSLF